MQVAMNRLRSLTKRMRRNTQNLTEYDMRYGIRGILQRGYSEERETVIYMLHQPIY